MADRDRLVRAFEELGCAQLYDACGGRAFPLSSRFVCRTPGNRFAGPLVPVSTANDMLPGLQGLALAQAGDVLFVQNLGPGDHALAGDIFLSACRQQQVAALVVDGSVRDLDDLADFDIPVYSTGVTFVSAKTAIQPAREVPETLSIDEIDLEPGTWLFGDSDGLLAVPAESVSVVVKAAILLAEREAELRTVLDKGEQKLAEIIGLDDFIAGRGRLSFDV